MRRENFRAAEDWKAEGLVLTTSSNEACKLYDVALTQMIGWGDDERYGGMEKTLQNMYIADPTFVLGRSLCLGMEVLGTGTTPRINPGLKSTIEELDKLAKEKRSVISDREYKHAMAIIDWSNGFFHKAAYQWEEIAAEHPTDIHAIKLAHDTYFYLGKSNQIRDSIARVLPHWEEKRPPLHNYIHGMHAFGLEETNLYSKAEKAARKGLEMYAKDGWATHALAHVLEMEGRTQEGVSFLSKTCGDWTTNNYLACHNYWHWALYHVELGEMDAAADIFQTEINRRAQETRSMLDLVDCTSLLYRMQLGGEKVEDQQWKSVYELCEPHLKDHVIGFNDAHFMMACLGAKQKDTAQELLDTLGDNPNLVGSETTKALLQSMIAFSREKYAEAVDFLNPVRYQLIDLGGSHAQRDVFNQLLIMAALKSSKDCHNRLALQLIHERKDLKNISPLTDRLKKLSVI